VRRRSRRYARILAIAVKHGLGPYPRFGSQSPAEEPQRRRRLAKSVRQAMEDGGVTFVKLGQLASTRPDLLPAEFVDEFCTLQDQVLQVIDVGGRRCVPAEEELEQQLAAPGLMGLDRPGQPLS